jgi:hypothetical protein
MGSQTYKATDPGAKRYEDLRKDNLKKGQPLPDKPKAGEKGKATEG